MVRAGSGVRALLGQQLRLNIPVSTILGAPPPIAPAAARAGCSASGADAPSARPGSLASRDLASEASEPSAPDPAPAAAGALLVPALCLAGAPGARDTSDGASPSAFRPSQQPPALLSGVLVLGFCCAAER
eukprot:CAMPEP_0202883036 /NCGR_PEP_ID=MMETSP1391-20130828/38836_1 /ASSEMBLY_ACC=CAM_ASM_000867 /TAXON_ID=1034604 /ORGANISM="Chlamydomonas leiostraca, Strain SAG 11-49" /LENGTH=130 /DNA_ID=CAMNT_0049565981 /DNA_START=797 /DNA_END=1191 /DNA_ORIENTATION=+